MEGNAVVLANGVYRTNDAKTAHGLVRGTDRFRVVAVVDPDTSGKDAGEVLDGIKRGIPIYGSLVEALEKSHPKPDTCIVGMATHGGALTPELRDSLVEAARAGLSLVNGLHECAGEDPRIQAAARETGIRIVDVRKPKPMKDLRFFTGEIRKVRAPRLAILGTDCALGKRTTARLLVEACRAEGIRAEMIFTGQTGWMQGARYGVVFDSLVNDFVCGEVEHAVVACDREASPDVIVIEGQSALRNPSGPCGAEFLVSAQARGVILQHAPGRKRYMGHEELGIDIPPVENEIELIRMYGARTLAVTLNSESLSEEALRQHQRKLAATTGIPVVYPLGQGVGELVPLVRRYIAEERG